MGFSVNVYLPHPHFLLATNIPMKYKQLLFIHIFYNDTFACHKLGNYSVEFGQSLYTRVTCCSCSLGTLTQPN